MEHKEALRRCHKRPATQMYWVGTYLSSGWRRCDNMLLHAHSMRIDGLGDDGRTYSACIAVGCGEKYVRYKVPAVPGYNGATLSLSQRFLFSCVP